MKKLLLSASIALLTVGGANAAVTDGDTYAPVNGINCENLWILDHNHNLEAWNQSAVGKAAGKARTAVTFEGVIYVGNSANDDPTVVDNDGAPVDCAGIEKYNLSDGAYLGKIKVTLDGVRISGLLCANQVGVDDFGNLWIASLSSSKASNYKIYSVDRSTGAATLQASLPRDTEGRIDYCDLVGDITRANAKCVVIAAANAGAAIAYQWVCEQGSTEWGGGWDGQDNSITFTNLYPADQIEWSYAPTVTIVLGNDEEIYDAGLFYIDGFTTPPTLYDQAYNIMESFEKAPDLTPKLGANGVAEFTVADKDFIAYVFDDYDKSAAGGCNINICELGAAMNFKGMTKYWMLPESGLGQTSDGGLRVHSIGTENTEDGSGIYLSTFKCMNGLGAYYIGTGSVGVNDATIGSGATITANGTVITVSEEASEIAIFNIAGQLVGKVNNATEIAAPAAGAYIVKATVAGSSVVKKIVL